MNADIASESSTRSVLSVSATAEEAAKGAGLDGFSLVEPLDLSLGDEFFLSSGKMDTFPSNNLFFDETT